MYIVGYMGPIGTTVKFLHRLLL